MLHLTGPTHTPEYQAARDLAARLTAAWPDIATHPHHQATLVAAAKCYGQAVCDIDLLLLLHTTAPIALAPAPGETRPVVLASVALVIECKEHQRDDVRFVGTHTDAPHSSVSHRHGRVERQDDGKWKAQEGTRR